MLSQLIYKLIGAFDAFNEYIGRGIAWLTSLLVLVFCFDVVSRYVFNKSQVAVFEAEWHIFSMIFLLGAAYTLRHDRHVRVDVFYSRFSVKAKAVVNLAGSIFFLIPFCLIVLKGSIPYVQLSFDIAESSSDPGGLPFRYLIKSCIIAGFVLLLLQSIVVVFHSLRTLLGFQPTS